MLLGCQVFPDASSLAQAACSAAHACGPAADWAQLQNLTGEVQLALDAAEPAASETAAEHEDDWGDWDNDGDDVTEASKPRVQDGDTAKPDLTSLRSQLSTVRLDESTALQRSHSAGLSHEGKELHSSLSV